MCSNGMSEVCGVPASPTRVEAHSIFWNPLQGRVGGVDTDPILWRRYVDLTGGSSVPQRSSSPGSSIWRMNSASTTALESALMISGKAKQYSSSVR